MKSAFGVPLLGLLLLLPFSAAHAAAPSVSPISNITLNAGTTATVNVVAVDLDGDAITLTSSVPAFATLNAPTTGTGSVVTTLTLTPVGTDVGTFTGSVKATAGGEEDSTIFQITVAADGSNKAPVVTAPAVVAGSEGSNLMFTVTASDADADAIVSLSPTGLPTGASFTADAGNTSGTFSWTPAFDQAGDYDVLFTATSGVLTGAATTHIHIQNVAELSIVAINDVTVAEGATMTVNVDVTGPSSGTIALTSSLPAFAGLNAPTSTTDAGALSTTITIAPPTGSAGTYPASVTATAGDQTVTENFTITVTAAGGGGGGTGATATLLGAFNTNRKFICFRVQPVDTSFDLATVDLSTVTLHFGGNSIAALAGKTHVTLDCDDEGEGDVEGDREGDHDGDCVTGDCGDDEGEGDCDDCPADSCETGLHACFAMSDVLGLFGDAELPSSFVDATVNGSLTGGGTFVATIGSKFAGEKGQNEKDLHAKVRPNPLNPTTKLTFRLSQPGRVRVVVYDLQGRLVKTLLDENRTVGDQALTWDGSSARHGKVSSGIYFFRIQAPQGEEVQRVTVLK